MSTTNNGSAPMQLFTNNKSLYASRTHTNQSSRKISIIEDKNSLEPVRTANNSSGQKSNSNIQRSASIPVTSVQQPSSSQIQKQIEIQKREIISYPLQQVYDDVFKQLDGWRHSIHSRIRANGDQCRQQTDENFQKIGDLITSMEKMLQENLIKTLLMAKENRQPLTCEQLDRIEEQLEEIKDEIDRLKELRLYLDCSSADVIGELTLIKLTDFNKHKPLPRPAPSPPPSPKEYFPSVSGNQTVSGPPETITETNAFESEPKEPLWSEATRKDLSKIASYLPFRLLISKEVKQKLIHDIGIEQFPRETEISCSSPEESILTINHSKDLIETIDVLGDLIGAFQTFEEHYEVRLLLNKKFLPIVTGKRYERLDRFRSTYRLNATQIFQKVCPQSDERVVSLSSYNPNSIVYCLREIFQIILEQAHFTDEDKRYQYQMYDPSIHYDETQTETYGGYKTMESSDNSVLSDKISSTEDLTEKREKSRNLPDSPSFSFFKNRTNREEKSVNLNDCESDFPEYDEELNDDEIEDDHDDDEKQIYVRHLNDFKGEFSSLNGQYLKKISEQTGAKIYWKNDENEPSKIEGTKIQIQQTIRLIKDNFKTQKLIQKPGHTTGRRQ